MNNELNKKTCYNIYTYIFIYLYLYTYVLIYLYLYTILNKKEKLKFRGIGSLTKKSVDKKKDLQTDIYKWVDIDNMNIVLSSNKEKIVMNDNYYQRIT